MPALLTPSSKVDPTSREGKILGFLEAEGRMNAITQNPNKWNDECGCACPPDDFPVDPDGSDGGTMGRSNVLHLAGCGCGIIDREVDPEKSILAMCTYSANVYHPKCAGLPAISKRVREDWACPECVWVAETGLDILTVILAVNPRYNLVVSI